MQVTLRGSRVNKLFNNSHPHPNFYLLLLSLSLTCKSNDDESW